MALPDESVIIEGFEGPHISVNNISYVQETYVHEGYRCSSEGLLLPIISEYTWSEGVRAFLYLVGLLYCFMGVAIIADIFMGAIEKITSKTRKYD
ncbi:sodium/calcium exchanger 2-like [Penaeus chinensis]|uniref:sodium/calcium exchanger 2-like n=1 Tax=Penaeus chinensis TaxID=139456 RepID=UPI001FB74DDD|nr:sodium/calcium exchanger 2-like [Penaeus chinensis]